MSHVRPLERADLAAVAGLAIGRDAVSRELVAYYERTLFDDPWTDPELPSLVYEDDDGSIAAFQGSVTRRAVCDGRPIRIACGVTAVSRPDVRRRGIGALLVRSYLAGPQDVTITDAATEEMRRIWALLGGHMIHASCIGWVRIFRPTAFATGRFAERVVDARGRTARAVAAAVDPAGRVAGNTWALVDTALTRVGRRLVPAAPSTSSEALTPAGLVECLDRVRDSLRLHVAYDERFAGWLFDELSAVSNYGEPVARGVRDGHGRLLGWYVYYLKRGGISHVLQVAALERAAGPVLDDLFQHAWTSGASALRGRVEPRLLAALGARGCIFRYVGGALVHTRDRDVLAAIATGDALLTRLDGEWWMGHYDPDLVRAE